MRRDPHSGLGDGPCSVDRFIPVASAAATITLRLRWRAVEPARSRRWRSSRCGTTLVNIAVSASSVTPSSRARRTYSTRDHPARTILYLALMFRRPSLMRQIGPGAGSVRSGRPHSGARVLLQAAARDPRDVVVLLLHRREVAADRAVGPRTVGEASASGDSLLEQDEERV